MRLDPRRMAVLLAVQRSGSVTGAARTLHLSPSAVSQQVALLEREVELQVMVRQPSGVTLTAAGQLLAESAERIETELADTRRSLAAVAGQISGVVTIAAFRTVARALLLPLIVELKERLPAVEVNLHDAEGSQAIDGLRSGLFDLAVVEAESPEGRTPPRGYEDVALLDEPWLVLTSTLTPTPRRLEDLRDVTWLGTDNDSTAQRATQRVFSRFPTAPKVQHQFSDYDVAVAMVGSGLGAALIPSLALPKRLPPAVRGTALEGLGVRRILIRYRATRSEPRREVRAVLDETTAAAAKLSAELWRGIA